ncbi:MAG: hypothetical protein RLZZ15_2529, partial [Verrucomicrobiota bacterium]
MRLIFINRFYWPDEPATAQLLADLAPRLAARGHDVTVIASHPGGAVPRTETRAGVRILRVRGPRPAGLGLLDKAAALVAFFLGAILRAFAIARPGDTVVAMTDPPLLGLGVQLAVWPRGARVIHWVQDIYPELAIALAGQRWLACVRPFRDLAWRRAAACVTLGTDMAATLARAGVAPGKISLLANWPPAGLRPVPAIASAALRAEWGLAEKFVVAYSGNLGRVHDLEPVLAVA